MGSENTLWLSPAGVRLGDGTAGGRVPGEWADSTGHAAGSHSSGPNMRSPLGGGE